MTCLEPLFEFNFFDLKCHKAKASVMRVRLVQGQDYKQRHCQAPCRSSNPALCKPSGFAGGSKHGLAHVQIRSQQQPNGVL